MNSMWSGGLTELRMVTEIACRMSHVGCMYMYMYMYIKYSGGISCHDKRTYAAIQVYAVVLIPTDHRLSFGHGISLIPGVQDHFLTPQEMFTV